MTRRELTDVRMCLLGAVTAWAGRRRRALAANAST
jgi:hypothetical protein